GATTRALTRLTAPSVTTSATGSRNTIRSAPDRRRTRRRHEPVRPRLDAGLTLLAIAASAHHRTPALAHAGADPNAPRPDSTQPLSRISPEPTRNPTNTASTMPRDARARANTTADTPRAATMTTPQTTPIASAFREHGHERASRRLGIAGAHALDVLANGAAGLTTRLRLRQQHSQLPTDVARIVGVVDDEKAKHMLREPVRNGNRA